MNATTRRAALFALVGGVIAVPVLDAQNNRADGAEPVGQLSSQYVPCPNEDSSGCVWDAAHRGNGLGQSFYTGTGGRKYPLPHRIAHDLLHR